MWKPILLHGNFLPQIVLTGRRFLKKDF